MFIAGRLSLSNSFFPKYNMPKSAPMIIIRSTITEPSTDVFANRAAKAKHSWLIGG